jgi:tetratricopeptide (TPR) repeat protein
MSRLKRIPLAQLLALLIASAIFIVFLSPTLFGKGNLNLGFIFLNRASASKTEEQKYRAIWKSEQFFIEASGFAKSEEDAKRGLGFTAWQKGEKADAVARWREAQIQVENLVAYGNLANKVGKRDEALSWYEAAAALDLAAAATPLAQQLHELGDFKGAIDTWYDALASYPESPQRLTWWVGLSSSLRGNQEVRRAEEVSWKALKEFPENPQLLTGLASALLSQNADSETVATILQNAISLDEAYADPYAVLAQLRSNENRYEEAFDYFSLAIERDPSVKWWHVARASMARRTGELEIARTLLLDTIDRFPKYAPAYYELAWVSKLAEDPVQAQLAIEKALDLHSAPPLNYYLLAGGIYAWSNQNDLARSAYQRAAELAPDDDRVIKGLESLKSVP